MCCSSSVRFTIPAAVTKSRVFPSACTGRRTIAATCAARGSSRREWSERPREVGPPSGIASTDRP